VLFELQDQLAQIIVVNDGSRLSQWQPAVASPTVTWADLAFPT